MDTPNQDCRVWIHEVEVIQEIDSGHKLDLPYSSKCNGWHGHRWKVITILRSRFLTNGMVADFTHVKEVIKRFDHKFFLYLPDSDLWEVTGPGELDWQPYVGNTVVFPGAGGFDDSRSTSADGILFTNFQPTAENLARLFFEEIETCLMREPYNGFVWVHSVELWETPSGKVVYSKGTV